jgi:hypothetical protein
VIKEVWYGSIGPFLYDDEDTYPDGAHHSPVHEIFMPTESGDVASKEYVDSVMEQHLLDPNPHPQYVLDEVVPSSDHERRGRLFEVDNHHNPRNLESR